MITEIPPIDAQEIAALISSIGGVAGGGAMGVTLLVAQLSMLALRSKLGAMAGKYRLGALYGITTITGITSLKAAGLGWVAAFAHAQTLAALQVFGHQVFKQIKEKKK